MKRRLRAPSPALVISLIALFIALGGTSYAAINALPKNSVGSTQLKKNAVTSKKIKNKAVTAGKINTAGLTVPNATHAGSADSATSATHATTAGGAPPTGAAGGALSGTYPNPSFAASEAERLVGGAGQPAFGTGWTNVGGSFQVAGFYKDGLGVVHLQGDVTRTTGTGSTIFTLPTGYCPTKLENFAAYGNNGTAAGVAIRASDCQVVYVAGDVGFIGLGGISFRAG